MSKPRTADELRSSWSSDARWKGIERKYSAEDVVKLRGSLHVEHTLGRAGAERLWNLMNTQPPVRELKLGRLPGLAVLHVRCTISTRSYHDQRVAVLRQPVEHARQQCALRRAVVVVAQLQTAR